MRILALTLMVGVVLLGGCMAQELSGKEEAFGHTLIHSSKKASNDDSADIQGAKEKSCSTCRRSFPSSVENCPYDGTQLK